MYVREPLTKPIRVTIEWEDTDEFTGVTAIIANDDKGELAVELHPAPGARTGLSVKSLQFVTDLCEALRDG